MPPQPRPFNEIPKTRKTLTDYSGLDSIQTYVMRPAHEDEIVTIFTHAIEHGKKVTLRGGAHAFDSQSLGADFVISMEEFAHINDPVKNAQFVSKIPLGRWGRVEEIGSLAVFLCSDEAGFVTGTDILIDGGWCAQ